VRVISLADFSKELCGGTHTRRTGDIGLFKIVHETSVAAGIRRIEALSGAAALAHMQQTYKTLQAVAHRLKTQSDGAVERIEQLLASSKNAEKEIVQLKARIAELEAAGGGGGGLETREISGVTVMAKRVSVDNPAAMRDLADKLKDKLGSGIVALGCETGGKALLLVGVTKDLVGRFHAGDLVKAAAALVGGGGGGRPDMAQAGGTKPEYLDAALEKVCELVGKA
jgi:alanyl-tRNA synthetase